MKLHLYSKSNCLSPMVLPRSSHIYQLINIHIHVHTKTSIFSAFGPVLLYVAILKASTLVHSQKVDISR